MRWTAARWLAPFAVVGGAWALRVWLLPVGDRPSFLPDSSRLVSSAWMGGVGPELLAFALASAALAVAAVVSAVRRARSSEARLGAIMESASDAIVTIDEAQRITLFNRAAETMFGWPREMARGQLLDVLIPERFRTRHRHFVRAFEETGETARTMGADLVLAGLRRNGEEFPMEARISQITVAGHALSTAIIRDVTDRRRAEEALHEAGRRKDEFLGIVSHELRNPLAALSAALRLVRTGPRADEALVIADRQVRRLVRLVDDLLDLSRMTRGTIGLHREVLDLAAIVGSAAEAARPAFEARRQTLDVALSGHPVWVDGDRARLEQVFANLLDNAAKYTDEGGHVALAVEDRGDDVVVRVQDDGIGIAAADLPRIFEVFTQGESASHRAPGGLGIGLAVVRRLVELHRGTVDVRSDGPGRGSVFTVCLPAVAEPVAVPGRREERTVVRDRAPLRLLLVDDNLDVLDSLATVLELKGYLVRKAEDGYRALALAQEETPNVVLLDIGLPGMDGYEVARRLRQEPGLERVVLVALSGYGRDEDRRRARDAGFDEHLTKPLDPDELTAVLAALVAGTA
ncbi:MAG: ATP-binding protein [Candidatus Binatia bacterium]